MSIFHVIALFGGLALFLYGMRMMGDGLKHDSSGALKKAMGKVTNSPIVGFLLGLCVTAVIQSSTATIVLTSGLVGAGIITLHQSIGIILGANVGTTVTGQIIRLLDLNAGANSFLNVFKPSTLAPLAAILGILLIMAFRFRNSDTIGTIAMGFGILFTGLMNMTAAVEPLSQSPTFAQLFVSLADKPLLGFLAGAGVAFSIQSSSATIGILQALSVTGQLTFGSVYPILVGIYLGDCVTTAIVCSIGAKADAKRTGMVHILFNLSEAVLVFAAVNILHSAGALDRIWAAPITSGGIANTHTLFNLACAVLLLPLCGLYEKLSRIVVHDDVRHSQGVEHELQLLDDKFFTSPELALSSSDEAIATMARLACAGADSAMDTLGAYDRAVIETVQENEQSIDMLADVVNNDLVRLSGHMEADDNSVLLNYYLQCFSEFERIGDYAVNLTESAEELHARGAQFSTTARQELAVLQDALHEIMGYAADAFTTRQARVARHIEPVEEVIDDLVETLRAAHAPFARRQMHGLRRTRLPEFADEHRTHRGSVLQPRHLHHCTDRPGDRPDAPRLHPAPASGRRFVLQRRIPGRTRKIFWPARRAGRLSSTESPLLIEGAFWRCGGTCGAESRPYKHIGTLQ